MGATDVGWLERFRLPSPAAVLLLNPFKTYSCPDITLLFDFRFLLLFFGVRSDIFVVPGWCFPSNQGLNRQQYPAASVFCFAHPTRFASGSSPGHRGFLGGGATNARRGERASLARAISTVGERKKGAT